jgi:hypothetical protein
VVLVSPPTGTAPLLRPLGVGELLDRAVTLCVRHFGTFALIYLAFALPLAIFQFYGTADQSKVVGALADAIRGSGGKPPDAAALGRALGSAPANASTYAFYFLTLVVAPLPAAALISATSRAYLGERVTFAAAYRAALRKWLPLIGIEVLYAVSAAVAYVLALLLGVVIVLALVLLGSALRWLAVTAGIVVGIVLLLAFALGVTLVVLAAQISFFACVVEGEPFIAAFSTGLGRVFGGGRIRRSLGVGLAYVAVSLGIFLVAAAGQSILLGLLRSNALGTVYGTLLRIGTVAFTTAFMAIFYYDLRVRSEGLDLQLEAQRTALLADSSAG